MGRRPEARRPARVSRQEAVCGANRRGAEANGTQGRGAHGHRHDPGPTSGLRRDRLIVHHGQHGERGRRAAHAARGAGDGRQAAADHHQCLGRRRPDARGHPLADADGESRRRSAWSCRRVFRRASSCSNTASSTGSCRGRISKARSHGRSTTAAAEGPRRPGSPAGPTPVSLYTIRME